MFAIVALLCFVLAAFGVDVGTINLTDVGLAFLALQLLWGWTPWTRNAGHP